MRAGFRCVLSLVTITTFALVATAMTPAASASPSPSSASADKATGKGSSRMSQRLRQLQQPDIQRLPAAAQAAAVQAAERGPGSLLTEPGGRLLVDLRLADTGEASLAAVVATGAEIVAVSSTDPAITVSVLPQQLAALEDLPTLRWANEVLRPRVGRSGAAATDAGPGTTSATCAPLVSEADVQLNAAAARSASAVDGTGIKIGILSDSFDNLDGAATDVAAGELPGPGNPCGRLTPVEVQAELPSGGEDEGRAMAQAVHDLAPGATLVFAEAFKGEIDFAKQIRDLQAGGAEVIVDDIGYYEEPMYQDGRVAKAINDVTALGATYFSAAGNDNFKIAGKNVSSYEASGGYRPATCPAGITGFDYEAVDCHDFDSGAGVDTGDAITVNNLGTLDISVGWNQPRLGITTDFDVLVVNAATNTVVASATDNNLSSQTASDYLYFRNVSGAAATYKIMVVRYAGTEAPRFKLIFNTPSGWTAVQWNTTTGTDIVGPTIYGHAAAIAAGSIAAVPYNNSNTVQYYSSRGPATYCFGPVGTTAAAPLPGGCQTKQLDVLATDGARNSFFGYRLADGLFHFFGTSQSAPHAAAVAALQLQARPCSTPAQILAAQRASGRAIAGFGQDAAGSGILTATTAITNLAPCGTAPTVSSVQPNSGIPAGGAMITIRGSGFTGVTSVRFGNTASPSFTVVDSTTIKAVSPARSLGLVNIFVVTPGGTSASGSPSFFNYVTGPTAVPSITLTSPNAGTTAGGTTVTMKGTGFLTTSAVRFGPSTPAASFSVINDTTLEITTPPFAAALVNVFVTNHIGISVSSSSSYYAFKVITGPAPTVSAVSPSHGPAAGGTAVTITGTGFTGTTLVRFGTTSVPFTVVNATTITVTSPAHAAGLVNVFVTSQNGTSPAVSGDWFAFQ